MIQRLILFSFSFLLFAAACKKKKTPEPPSDTTIIDTTYGGYPDAVGKIFHAKCVDGCHDTKAKRSELAMDTWDHLFYGGSHGASVVPYSTDYSLLLHYINTNLANGPVATPGMPYELPPLSEAEYKTIKEWIANGAPDRNGKIAFADNPDTRQKIYVTQQCDQLAVIDAERMVVMRYIPIGKGLETEVPHCVRVTADGRYAFVSFTNGYHLQKIDTQTDSIVAEVDLGAKGWEILLPSASGDGVMMSTMGGQYTYFVNTIAGTWNKSGQMGNPHGLAALPGFDRFFIAMQKGNVITKMSRSDPFVNKQYTLDGKTPNINLSIYDPHELMLSPDNDRLFATCEFPDSLAVLDTSVNVIKMIKLGRKPQEMAISKKHGYLFVSCTEEPSPLATAQVCFKGAVYVLNYKTLEIVAKIEGPFMESHGIAVDDRNNRLYIFSRNYESCGLAPHHYFGCSGKNGFFHVYDMDNFTNLQGKRELLPNPYSADVRFK